MWVWLEAGSFHRCLLSAPEDRSVRFWEDREGASKFLKALRTSSTDHPKACKIKWRFFRISKFLHRFGFLRLAEKT